MNITSILLSSAGTVFAVGLYVMNALIAFGVYLDAQKQTVSAHRDLKLFSPGTWGADLPLRQRAGVGRLLGGTSLHAREVKPSPGGGITASRACGRCAPAFR
jgi:hypothetical protein